MAGTSYNTGQRQGYQRALALEGAIGTLVPDITEFGSQLDALAPVFDTMSSAGLEPSVVFTPMADGPHWVAACRETQTPLRLSLAAAAYRGHPDYRRYTTNMWVASVMGSVVWSNRQLDPVLDLPHLKGKSPGEARRALTPLLATVLAACIKRPDEPRPPDMMATVVRDRGLGGIRYKAECSSGVIATWGPGALDRSSIPRGINVSLAPLGGLATYPLRPTVMATEIDERVMPVRAEPK